MPTQPAILGSMRLGNFRLGYRPAALTPIRAARVRITLAGVEARTRIAGLTVHDVLNDAPNTCSLTIDGSETPVNAQRLRVSINADTPRLLFNGALQTVDLSYEGLPAQLAYPCTAIDDLADLNRRRPFGTWTNVSATTIALAIVAAYAPGFSAAGIAAGLPLVSVNLDGSEGFSGALGQLAKLIGGYFKAEDLVVYLFTDDTADPPDDIDDTPGRFLDDPPITLRTDDSQLRTRVYGRGHGEATLSDVAAGETIVPIANAVMFTPGGGRAISDTQQLAYTGVQLGGAGSVAGPSVTPVVAPIVAMKSGAGITDGAHQYAVVFATAAGKSLPGPLASITVGPTPTPAVRPSAGLLAGVGPDPGVHRWAYTVVNAAGETLPSPVSNDVTTISTPVADPIVAPTIFNGWINLGSGSHLGGPGSVYLWALVWVDPAGGQTLPGPTYTATNPGVGFAAFSLFYPAPPPDTTARLYRTIAGGSALFFVANLSASGGTYLDGVSDASLGAAAPTVNTCHDLLCTGNLNGILPGDAATTARNLYRTAAGGTQLKLVATIADNVTQSFLDTVADASLGANAPTVGTAAANQVTLSGIPLGPTGTTGREVYRTAAGAAQLKLQQTIANNTATVGVADATADGSLGANAPTSDTSGLSTAVGQINAGSASLVTAGAGPFSPTGGWAQIGQQVARYTGITGNTLTGIPISGPGALTSTVKYGEHVDAAPALTGVTGISVGLVKGAPVNIWIQRDDLAAQADQAAIDLANGRVPADGIYDGPPIVDERRGEASLIALCDATLALFSRPIQTVTFAARDPKLKSGKPLHFAVTTPPIGPVDLTIQEVTIDQIDVAPGTLPRFSVTASSVRQSLDDLLRRMAAALGA